ncbi:MAG TPA: hypothetical protein VGJ04_00435 [Pirellulales bacterium]|jgi:hypothetical protein
MTRRLWQSLALLLLAAGCSSSGGSAPGTQSSSAQDGPDRTVFAFLEAVRAGNDQQTANLLTPKALQKTSEMQMSVAPPTSPTAKFTVGNVKYISPEKDGAYVSSTWTDKVDDEGHTRTDEIVWVLRRETVGWRIAGMATQIYPDRPPLILNFEDPEDMLRKQQLLHEGDAEVDSQSQSSGEPEAKRAPQAPPVTR